MTTRLYCSKQIAVSEQLNIMNPTRTMYTYSVYGEEWYRRVYIYTFLTLFPCAHQLFFSAYYGSYEPLTGKDFDLYRKRQPQPKVSAINRRPIGIYYVPRVTKNMVHSIT